MTKSDIADIGKRAAKGAGWTVFMRFAIRSFGIVSTLILARILVPEDFGLVALATMLLGMLEAMSEFNFAVYLIRERSVNRSHYDTAWSLSVLRGIIIAVFLATLAPFAADFFAEPRLENVVYAIAIITAVAGFTNIGIVEFQKELDFHKDFQFLVYTRLISFIVTIVLAFTLRSYWALVLGIASGHLTRLVLSYTMHKFRPRVSFARTGQIMRFSKWVLANGIISFANSRADVIVIGRFFDTATLGIYSIAHEIATLAITEIVSPIHRAVLAGFSKLNGDAAVLRTAFIEAQSIIILIGLPIAAGIGLTADPLVRLALGDKWLDAIPLIQILALISITRVCLASTSPMVLAAGRPHLNLITSGVGIVVGIPLLIAGTMNWGITGAAWALSASAFLRLVVNYGVMAWAFDITPRHLLPATWRPIAACGLMALAVGAYLAQGPSPEGIGALLLTILSASLIGAFTYIAGTLVLWRLSGAPDSAEGRVLWALRNLLGRLRRRRLPGTA